MAQAGLRSPGRTIRTRGRTVSDRLPWDNIDRILRARAQARARHVGLFLIRFLLVFGARRATDDSRVCHMERHVR